MGPSIYLFIGEIFSKLYFAPAVSGQQPAAGQSAHLFLRLIGLDLLLQGTALQP